MLGLRNTLTRIPDLSSDAGLKLYPVARTFRARIQAIGDLVA